MKLLLAVSSDCFVARGPEDDMKWTDRHDKSVFKLLTTVGNPILCAGYNTYRQLPKLPGREVIPLSRYSSRGLTLEQFHHEYVGGPISRDIILIGGQTVALEAMDNDMIHEVILCMSTNVKLENGIRCDRRIFNFGHLVQPIVDFEGVSVQVLRR